MNQSKLKPYEVVKTGKEEYFPVGEDLYSKSESVILLPIEKEIVWNGKTYQVQENGMTVAWMDADEVVWVADPETDNG